MLCPACGLENLPGAEECESCLTSLFDVGLPKAKQGLQKRLLTETVGQLAPKTPICVKPSETLQAVIDLMNHKHLGCVLVKEGNEIEGIFTERDALLKLGQSLIGQPSIDLKKGLVKEYMTAHPETIDASQSLALALNKMSVGGYRHLPVTRDQQVMGIISIRDILRYLWE